MIQLDTLAKFDTPTICNALELIDSSRKNHGYTIRPFHCTNKTYQPVIGIAKTATMRSLMPSSKSTETLKKERVEYYKYIDSGDYPKICLMQDIDGEDSGRGPFWGEFNTRIHQSLGVKSIITNGTVRDVQNLPENILILSKGLCPSHANVHVVDYDVQVNVNGLVVSPGDVIHADPHGAVSFPPNWIPEIEKKAIEFIESEKPILDGCKREGLSIEDIIKLYMER